MKRKQLPEEFEQTKRMALVHLAIALVAQVAVLLGYVFKEKQVILAFPMLISILVTVLGMVNVLAMKRD